MKEYIKFKTKAQKRKVQLYLGRLATHDIINPTEEDIKEQDEAVNILETSELVNLTKKKAVELKDYIIPSDFLKEEQDMNVTHSTVTSYSPNSKEGKEILAELEKHDFSEVEAMLRKDLDSVDTTLNEDGTVDVSLVTYVDKTTSWFDYVLFVLGVLLVLFFLVVS
jgi:hypothetical protein